MMYHKPQVVVQVNGRHSETFAIERSVRQGSPLSPLLSSMSSLWSPCSVGSVMRGQMTLRGVPFAGPLTARVSAFADDITIFVSHCLYIKAVKEAVGEYKRIAGAKVNFDKSEGLRLGAWRGSDTLPGPSAGATDPSASSRYGSDPTSNWSEIGRKYKLR